MIDRRADSRPWGQVEVSLPGLLGRPLRRRRSVAMAGHTGDVVTARAGLDDTDPEVRAAALRSLERLGALDTATLARSTRDPGVAVRLAAVELAASRPEIDVSGLLDDRDPSVAEQAAWCCGERPADHRPVKRLAGLVREHPDPLVREAAVASLGALGSPHGRCAILLAMRDKPAVRRRAVIAMAGFDGADITEAIERARHDRNRQVRDTVADLWGDGEPQGIGPVGSQ